MLPMLIPRSLMSKQGMVMGMRPSFTMLKDTLAPTSITSSRVIWAATVTRAPVWTQIGKGAMPNRSRVNGSGLPSDKLNLIDMLNVDAYLEFCIDLCGIRSWLTH